MRNLLALAIALSVNLKEDDVLELGYDATDEDFKTWFEIPEDAETTAGYKKDEDFDVKNLEQFMNAEEIASLNPAQPVDIAAPAPKAKKETAAEKKARLAAEKNSEETTPNADETTPNADETTPNADGTTPDPAPTVVKKPGVIASILQVIVEAKEPVSEAKILEKLITLFPERDKVAMSKTVKAQLGGKNQPLRMEEEKKVKFALTQSEVKDGEKSQRLYAIAK